MDFLEVVQDGEKVYTVMKMWSGKRLERQAAEHGLAADDLLARGKKAKHRLADLVEGRAVNILWLHGHVERGPYCRLTAYVEVDGQNVAEIMLAEGLVWISEQPDRPRPRSERYRQVGE